MNRLLALWRTRPRLTTAFLLACAVTLYFAGRFVTFTVYWATHQDMPVEPWMTLGYAARSWGLDPRELAEEMGLPAEAKGNPMPLSDIARSRGVPVSQVVSDVEAAIAALNQTGTGE